MADILRVGRLAAFSMVACVRTSEYDCGSMLYRLIVSQEAQRGTGDKRAIMLSRMNDCVGLGRTGYPFVFAMNVDDGRKMKRTDSAIHLLSIPRVVGRGGVKSKAASHTWSSSSKID